MCYYLGVHCKQVGVKYRGFTTQKQCGISHFMFMVHYVNNIITFNNITVL